MPVMPSRLKFHIYLSKICLEEIHFHEVCLYLFNPKRGAKFPKRGPNILGPNILGYTAHAS
jgi:hypothetical protein